MQGIERPRDAHLASLQDKAGRYWLNEQPAGSWLYYEDPWPEVLARKSTVEEEFDPSSVFEIGRSRVRTPYGGGSEKY